ncbi:MAG: ferritin-like domain-containing protein [Anaerolineae bacterium]
MTEENKAILDALMQAMDREQEAREFYRDAMEKVADSRGRDLLQQLAEFEDYHYRSLRAWYRALVSGEAPPAYQGRELSPGLEAGQAGREAQSLETAVDILTTAMEAERAAQARYEAWAARATLPSVQCLFRRLAHEESIHERILNDEFYSLSNRGIWLWGD